MLHSLQHFHLVVYHLLIAPDALLEDNLDRTLALGAICLSNNAICTSAECLAKPVFGP